MIRNLPVGRAVPATGPFARSKLRPNHDRLRRAPPDSLARHPLHVGDGGCHLSAAQCLGQISGRRLFAGADNLDPLSRSLAVDGAAVHAGARPAAFRHAPHQAAARPLAAAIVRPYLFCRRPALHSDDDRHRYILHRATHRRGACRVAAGRARRHPALAGRAGGFCWSVGYYTPGR